MNTNSIVIPAICEANLNCRDPAKELSKAEHIVDSVRVKGLHPTNGMTISFVKVSN